MSRWLHERRGGRHFTFVVLGACLPVILTVSGCTTGSSEARKDLSARALLDFKTGEIILPLDAYDATTRWADFQSLQRATYLAVDECMVARGQRYTAAHIIDAPDTNIGDRLYGLWNVDYVRKYGYDSPEVQTNIAIAKDAEAGGDAWGAAWKTCYETTIPTEIRSLIPGLEEQRRSLVSRLRAEARSRAEADPGWAAARVPWAACLQKAGLEPHTDGWRSKQAQDMIMSENDVPTQGTQELSRIAYIEAKCNVESGLTQNLGNLEAGYQQPLIDANQAALNKVKEQAQQRLATAKAYIATHG